MIARHRPQARPHQSRSFAEAKHRRKVVVAVAGIIAVSTWLFTLSSVSYFSIFRISDVQIYGATPDLDRTIATATYQELDGSRLALFSRANSLIYPRRSIASAVAADPRVDSVEVSREGLRAIAVSVSEKAAAAVVCRDLPDWEIGIQDGDSADTGHCYEADHEGRVIRKASSATVATDRYYAPTLSDQPIGGLFATSTVEYLLLSSFIQNVRVAGIKPLAILIKEGQEYEMYVESPADKNAVTIIYFNTSSELSRQLSNLTTFFGRVGTDISLKSPARLEYVDIRYGSNVFYRISGQ